VLTVSQISQSELDLPRVLVEAHTFWGKLKSDRLGSEQ
jgi:hypothetical protein